MQEFVASKLYGIIGNPLGHTLSPALHTTAFKLLGLPGVLLPWPMTTDKLPAFIKAMRILDIQGVCVTIPHKQTVMPLLDSISERARKVGAVNLIYRQGNELIGDNTDVPGFVNALEKPPLPHNTRALVLGSGGASRAIITGLKSLGISTIAISNHNSGSAFALAKEFDLTPIAWESRGREIFDLVVNTTPLGMKGKFIDDTPYPEAYFKGRTGIAYDIVYSPLETVFLREARTAGWRCINGLEMFLGQADHQFFIWTGQHLPLEAKQVVIDALTK